MESGKVIGLDYFLDAKWLKKISSKVKDDTFVSPLPAAIQQKFRWEFRENYLDDKLTYDYIKAYRLDEMVKAFRAFRYIDIISILLLDGNLQDDTNLYKMYQKLGELNNNLTKPLTYDEKLMKNMLEVYDLIFQHDFPLNEENFELVVHILFRNLDYDLERPASLKRSSKSKNKFDNLLDPILIDVEMRNFWNYLSKDNSDNFSGFTEAFMLGLEILYISPFDSLNLILMQFVIKWYIFQLDNTFNCLNYSYYLCLYWDEFHKIVEKCFSENFFCDAYFKFIRQISQAQINLSQRYVWITSEIDNFEFGDLEKKIKDQRNIFFMAELMRLSEEFNVKDLDNNYFYKNNYISKNSILSKLELFVEANILRKERSLLKEVYCWENLDFKKIKDLLKD